MNDTSLVLLVWSTALVFLLIRTQGFKNSVATTIMIITLFIVAILHRMYGDIGCLYIFALVITGLTLRPIPRGHQDKWDKHKVERS